MILRGSCHCKNVSFGLVWEPDPAEIPARACMCSFCTRHGNVWTASPSASLVVHVDDPSTLSKYAFETKTAEFFVCRACGVVPVATSAIDGRVYAVVNVNAFESDVTSLLSRSVATFAAETQDARLGRRKRNWIARVAFV